MFDANTACFEFIDDLNVNIFPEKYLEPQDVIQFLYKLVPKSESNPSSALGKLDISWRGTFGQTGRLQTSQLTRKISNVEPFSIKVVKIPNLILSEEPFSIDCVVSNNTEALVDLTVSGVKSKMTSVLCSGKASTRIGQIKAGQFVSLTLVFFPLVSGIQKVRY